jgi:hypothetical protein
VTSHLFIVSSRQKYVIETTLAGVLVRKINMPFCGAGCNLCDLVFAPGTDGSPRRLYLTDPGRDNDAFWIRPITTTASCTRCGSSPSPSERKASSRSRTH